MALSAPELAVLIKARDEASGVLKGAGASVRGFGGAVDALKPVLLASTAAAAGMGAGLFKLGKDFDEAFDTIRVGTGATGLNLAQLQDDFRFVVKEIPTDFNKASAAIADLNTLTGLTGPVLQDAAKRGLEAARLLGEDSAALFGATARALNSFEVSGQDAGAVMDQLFVASQATGVPMGALAGQLQTYGPVLKNLGLGITESTALFGSLSKAGIDASRVLPGLNAFMRKLAKEGVTDMQEALSDAITDIKGAESASEALNIATASFGAEGAQRMSVAVRTGALDLDGLINKLNTSGGAIMETSRDTQSFGERWQVALNNISVAVEPAATRIFDLASTLLDDLSPALKTGLGGLVDFAEKGINFITAAWDNAASFREGLRQLAAAILPSVGAAVEGLQRDWEKLTPKLQEAWDNLEPLRSMLKKLGEAVLPTALLIVQRLTDQFKAMASQALPALFAAVGAVLDGFNNLVAFGREVKKFFADNQWAVDAVASALITLASVGIAKLLLALPGLIASVAATTVAFLAQAAAAAAAAVATLAAAAPFLLLGLAIAGAIFIAIQIVRNWDTIIEKAGELVSAVGDILGSLGALKDQMWDVLLTLGEDIINGILQGIRNIGPGQVLSPLLGLLGGVVEGVKEFLGIGSPSKVFAEIGAGIVQGLQEGITAAWEGLTKLLDNKLSGVIAFAKDIFGESSPSRVFAAIGKDIALGMAQGISENEVGVLNTVRRVNEVVTSAARKVVNDYLQSVNIGVIAAANNLPGNISLQDLTRVMEHRYGGESPATKMSRELDELRRQQSEVPTGSAAFDRLSSRIREQERALEEFEKAQDEAEDQRQAARETEEPVTGLSFARGGTVPGPIGQPRLAVVHGGERVIPNGVSADVQVTIVNNGAIGVPDLEEMIANLINARFRRGGYQEIFS